MLVIQEADLHRLQSHIGSACRCLTDNTGRRVDVPTIDHRTLNVAAMIALQICAGEVVWDATKPLRLLRPKQPVGVVNILEE